MEIKSVLLGTALIGILELALKICRRYRCPYYAKFGYYTITADNKQVLREMIEAVGEVADIYYWGWRNLFVSRWEERVRGNK